MGPLNSFDTFSPQLPPRRSDADYRTAFCVRPPSYPGPWMVTVGDLLLGPLPPHFLGICGKSETLENVRNRTFPSSLLSASAGD